MVCIAPVKLVRLTETMPGDETRPYKGMPLEGRDVKLATIGSPTDAPVIVEHSLPAARGAGRMRAGAFAYRSG